jgi:phenylacetate-CoA ligase
MRGEQFDLFKELLQRLAQDSPFYKNKFSTSGINIGDIKTPDDIRHLPLTTKEELRDVYPLGLQAVPDEKVVRIHSSSGTTGKPVIIPYTANDVRDWSIMMARCYDMAGLTPGPSSDNSRVRFVDGRNWFSGRYRKTWSYGYSHGAG